MKTRDTHRGSTCAVVFDLDGTLADTLNDVTGSLNYALRQAGSPTYSRDEVAEMIGDGVSKLVERALGAADDAAQHRVRSDFIAHYRQHAMDGTHLYEGIPEQLDLLAANGWALAVVSNKTHEFTVQICNALLSKWRFVVVLGMQEGVPAKPDPTGAQQVVAKLGLHPRRIYFVGDSPMDVITARRAGMISVGAAWGYRGAAALEIAGPDLMVVRPGDLAECLLKHARSRGMQS